MGCWETPLVFASCSAQHPLPHCNSIAGSGSILFVPLAHWTTHGQSGRSSIAMSSTSIGHSQLITKWTKSSQHHQSNRNNAKIRIILCNTSSIKNHMWHNNLVPQHIADPNRNIKQCKVISLPNQQSDYPRILIGTPISPSESLLTTHQCGYDSQQ